MINMPEKNYRGFDKKLQFYYVNETKYPIKEVKGLKPKELAKVYASLAERDESINTLSEQIKYNEDWDNWTKDVLETYLEFDYDKEVDNFDLTVLRKMGAEIFSFLMIAGTNRKEYELSKKQFTEMQQSSQKMKSS